MDEDKKLCMVMAAMLAIAVIIIIFFATTDIGTNVLHSWLEIVDEIEEPLIPVYRRT